MNEVMILNACLIVSLIGNLVFIILLCNKPDRNLELMQLMELRLIKADNEINKLKIVNRYYKGKLKDTPEYYEPDYSDVPEPPPAPPGRELGKPIKERPKAPQTEPHKNTMI